MRSWLVIILMTISANLFAYEKDIDKAAHFGLSYGITLTATQLCKKLIRSKSERWQYTFGENLFCSLSGATVSMMMGIAKETNDPKVDWRDIQADFYGTMGATILNLAIDI